MSGEDRIYSVLIVSSSKNFQEIVDANFPDSKYHPLHTAQSVSAAKRKASENSYDFIIVNSPLPDDPGIRFSIDTASESAVLLIVSSDYYEEINSSTSCHGVFVLPKPFSKSLFTTAINWLSSAREIVKRSQKKSNTLEEKMEEIRIVNRAKWLLINELKMAEPEAHRYIEKQAMDRCISKKSVALEIIKTYS